MLSWMRPSWGSRRSEMFEAAEMTLTREMTAQGEVLGGRGHFVERAVHAVADAEFVLEGLEVDVRGARLHGLVAARG
jgi:hypothetical protein